MIKNFIVDHIIRGNMYDTKTNELLWSLNQISNPSLSMESESVDATDALGTPIMSFCVWVCNLKHQSCFGVPVVAQQ